MSELLSIKKAVFIKEMNEHFEVDQNITSVDVFDTFVKALSKDTNVLSEEKLKGLVFRQFKGYGDFDKTMQDVAQSVSDIKQSTEDAMTAIDNNDAGGLKSAYNQLKSYEARIQELEKDIYTDDVTGIYNRKFLMNQELDPEGCFKTDGVLLHITVNNFSQLNHEHGHEAGDTVLKFVSKVFQNSLKNMGIHLIRYMGVQFVAVAKDRVAVKASKICMDGVDTIMKKTFKTHEGEVLHIDMQFVEVAFKKGQSFQEVHETI